jgi:hypothetical protein
MMLLRYFLAVFAVLASLNVQAASEWVALNGVNSDSIFVNRANLAAQGDLVDVEVLRDFSETITLGNDAVSGDPLFAHRSITLTYRVDCTNNTLAMLQWQMFEGNQGEGPMIWNQQNANGLAYLNAVDPEMNAVLRSACGTTTVAR